VYASGSSSIEVHSHSTQDGRFSPAICTKPLRSSTSQNARHTSGWPALFRSTGASSSWHISSGRTAHLGSQAVCRWKGPPDQDLPTFLPRVGSRQGRGRAPHVGSVDTVATSRTGSHLRLARGVHRLGGACPS
jgi:hypothetical protein